MDFFSFIFLQHKVNLHFFRSFRVYWFSITYSKYQFFSFSLSIVSKNDKEIIKFYCICTNTAWKVDWIGFVLKMSLLAGNSVILIPRNDLCKTRKAAKKRFDAVFLCAQMHLSFSLFVLHLSINTYTVYTMRPSINDCDYHDFCFLDHFHSAQPIRVFVLTNCTECIRTCM